MKMSSLWGGRGPSSAGRPLIHGLDQVLVAVPFLISSAGTYSSMRLTLDQAYHRAPLPSSSSSFTCTFSTRLLSVIMHWPVLERTACAERNANSELSLSSRAPANAECVRWMLKAQKLGR